jgi:hypothetical protein
MSYLFQYIYFEKKWKNLFIIKNGKNESLISTNTKKKKIKLSFKGNKKLGEFVDKVLEVFNFLIKSSYPLIKIEKKVSQDFKKYLNFEEIIEIEKEKKNSKSNNDLLSNPNILFYGYDYPLNLKILSYINFFFLI